MSGHPLQTSDPANEWLRGIVQDAIRGWEQPALRPHGVVVSGLSDLAIQ